MRGADSAETTSIHVLAATGCWMAAGKSQLWDQARHIRVEGPEVSTQLNADNKNRRILMKKKSRSPVIVSAKKPY